MGRRTCHGHELRHVLLPKGTLSGTGSAPNDWVLDIEHQVLLAV